MQKTKASYNIFMRWKWNYGLVFLAYVLFTFGAYYNAIYSEFISDDIGHIIYNQNNLRQGLAGVVSGPLADRPVLMATMVLNYYISGFQPVSYKLLSLLLHAFVGLLIFLLFLELAKDKTQRVYVFAFLAGALFVLHPMNNQAINSIIQRGVILSALFSLASFIFYIRYGREGEKKFLYGSYLTFLLGVLSKSNGILLPIGFWLYSRWFEPKNKQKSPLIFAPYAFFSVLPSIYYFYLGLNAQTEKLPAFTYFLTQIKVVLLYLKIFLWPVNLRFLYEIEPGLSIIHWLTWLCLVIHIILIAGLVYLWKKQQRMAFFLFILAYINLLPESSFFSIMHTAFEHRMYFPFLFVLMGVVHLFYSSRINAKIIAGVALVIGGAYAGINIQRNQQINTLPKWVLNTLHYTPSSANFNIFYMDEFLLTDIKTGLEMSHYLVELYPQDEIYQTYDKIFMYMNEPKKYSQKTLDEVKIVLLKPVSIHWIARKSFIRFYAVNIPAYYKGIDGLLKLDEMLYPQIPELMRLPDRYGDILKNYRANLLNIKAFYEQKGVKSEVMAQRYMRALLVLEKVYGDVSREYVLNRITELKSKKPRWSLPENLR